MRIMIRSYSEKCQVHDVESAADTEKRYLYLIFHTVLQEYCSILIMILLVLDLNEY